MSPIRIRSETISFPALFIHRTGFEVWPESKMVPPASTLCGAVRDDTSAALGVLVDSEGQAYRVVDAEDASWQNGKHRSREERLALLRQEVRQNNRSVTFICDQGPTAVSVEELRQRVGWIVSAQGHFESPTGFGLPDGTTYATSVKELLQVLMGKKPQLMGYGRPIGR